MPRCWLATHVFVTVLASRSCAAQDLSHTAAFGSTSPLGKSLMCPPKNLAAITPEVLNAFIAEQYCPSKMVLAAAGELVLAPGDRKHRGCGEGGKAGRGGEGREGEKRDPLLSSFLSLLPFSTQILPHQPHVGRGSHPTA